MERNKDVTEEVSGSGEKDIIHPADEPLPLGNQENKLLVVCALDFFSIDSAAKIYYHKTDRGLFGGVPLKKEDIINVALKLFLEKGYEKTTITDIMKEAKLSKGGMYHHFVSKEAIFDAAVKKALVEEQNIFEKAVHQCDNVEEKLALLFMNPATSSDYLKDFSFFVQQERSALIFYKLRDIFRQQGTENLKVFLIEGMTAGKFNFDMTFINEISKTVYCYGEEIAFRALAESDKNSFLQKEFIAFFYIIERLLNSSEEFNKNFRRQLLRMFQ